LAGCTVGRMDVAEAKSRSVGTRPAESELPFQRVGVWLAAERMSRLAPRQERVVWAVECYVGLAVRPPPRSQLVDACSANLCVGGHRLAGIGRRTTLHSSTCTGSVAKGRRSIFLGRWGRRSRCQTLGPTGKPVGAGVTKGQRSIFFGWGERLGSRSVSAPPGQARAVAV
jgi:hypothetical protein